MWPEHLPELPEVKSFIGVIFAVTGNILISVALNIQKSAHNELNELQRPQLSNFDPEDLTNNSNTRTQSSPGSDFSSHNNNDEYVVLLEDSETHYLRSKAWWAGILLMMIGEFGNFMAYAFAPASVVAPLGTVALISNVILAPIMLKERFRGRDLIGILMAIIGAVIVVISSKSDVVKLTPEAIWNAIKQTKFVIYFLTTLLLAILLMCLSNEVGNRTSFVDLSLVAIFGGYTVLATKSISSMLTMKFVLMFTYPLTYLIFSVLIVTAVLQIKFLNKALKQFDSTEVVPTQFVLFTISAIIGSAVLYNDFADMDFLKFNCFFAGCTLTFGGVFLITSNRNESDPSNLSSGSGTVIADEVSRQYSSFGPRSGATTIPRRHTYAEATASTPLLSHSSSRNDGIFKSLGASATSLLLNSVNSVGTHHSHALTLDKVFENYNHKGISEQNRTNSSYSHRRSNSVPPGLISRGIDYSNGATNSPLATNIEDDNGSTQPNSYTNSSSYSNSEYYNSEYTDFAQTDDDERTISVLTISTNGSNIGSYMGDESSTYGSSYDYSDDTDYLPDLPLRRDYSGEGDDANDV